ncbi:phospholipid phosphatase [Capnocytophaga sp. HP1101]
MKILLLIVAFCFILIQSIKAQTDSLSVLHQSVLTADTLHIATEKPQLKQVILPASLITLGVISNATYINRYVQRHTYRYSGGHKLRFDDYIQYLPIASVFAYSNLGIKAKHSVKERLIVGATAYAITAALVNGTKYSARVHRPDGSAHNSFPSGHTATAFTGMEILWQEYKDENIWVGISGYAIATTVGVMRLYNNRHWIGDVLVGAGIGMLSAKTAYWLLPYTSKWFTRKEKSSVQMVVYPVYSDEMKGVGLTLFR